jgi:hypothetical protein
MDEADPGALTISAHVSKVSILVIRMDDYSRLYSFREGHVCRYSNTCI